MIDDYIDGAIAQLIERSRKLVAMIPRDLPRLYDGLSQRCRQELANVLRDLRFVAEDELLQKPENRLARLRAFRRIVADLDSLESMGIAALSRAHKDDDRLNELIAKITTEICYPLPAPACTTLSRDYFYINQHLGLMFLPLAEGHFILHLPDIYHELAHPVLSIQDDPVIEPYQERYAEAIGICLEYTHSELVRLERGRSPEGTKTALRAWESSWVRGWLAEFFCDLFAVFTVGPAFAWSHLHLTLKRGSDPYRTPVYAASSHPADDARMSVALKGLSLAGFTTEALQIKSAWSSCMLSLGYRPEPEYDLCFPKQLLHRIAEMAFTGVKAMGIRVVDLNQTQTVARKLNDGWSLFWTEPSEFASREKDLVAEIFSLGAYQARVRP